MYIDSNSCLRRVKLKNAFNFRDLGGYYVSSRSYTRWGKIFRSDSLDMLNTEEWNFIKDSLNVVSIIDLRSKEESKRFLISPPKSIDVLEIPLISENYYIDIFDQTLDIDLHREDIHKNLIQDYSRIAYENMHSVVKVLDIINYYLKIGGVVFFCSAGKDRTGIMAALILYLCGVSEADIVADYCITEIYNGFGINRRLDTQLNKTIEIEFSEELKEMRKASPLKIKKLLCSFTDYDIVETLNDYGFVYKKQNELINQIVINNRDGE